MSGGFFGSFKYAGKGLWTCLRRERNMRFHIGMCFLLAFALAGFSVPAVYCLTAAAFAALTLFAESVNSALEALADYACGGERHPAIAKVKDIAAGGVLAVSVIAAGAGLYILVPAYKNSLASAGYAPPPVLAAAAAAAFAACIAGAAVITIKERGRTGEICPLLFIGGALACALALCASYVWLTAAALFCAALYMIGTAKQNAAASGIFYAAAGAALAWLLSFIV